MNAGYKKHVHYTAMIDGYEFRFSVARKCNVTWTVYIQDTEDAEAICGTLWRNAEMQTWDWEPADKEYLTNLFNRKSVGSQNIIDFVNANPPPGYEP